MASELGFPLRGLVVTSEWRDTYLRELILEVHGAQIPAGEDPIEWMDRFDPIPQRHKYVAYHGCMIYDGFMPTIRFPDDTPAG